MSNADVHFLGMAARLALRGHGGAEPNPMVGCVIVQPASGRVVGWGYHRRCGGPHAEVVALQRAGEAARGATLYCTLEPCNHTGRTPPCADSIIRAGIGRVVMARRDPHELAAGGMDKLRAAGIDVELNERCVPAVAVSDSFVHRVRTGLPWVTAKWAQTIDGKVATRTGESKWISNEASRKLVHRERGRVDAILTGFGTVLNDDPLLTARGVRVRRIARRVVIDPFLQVSPSDKVVLTGKQAPTTFYCCDDMVEHGASLIIKQSGGEIVGMPHVENELSLREILLDLSRRHDVSNVLVEGGPGLLSRLFKSKLVNDALVFIAPMLLGDARSRALITDFKADALAQAMRMELLSLRRRGGDIVARYRCT